ncbi:MAG: alpha/beta fold hydrolase [Chloroflexi bacterium]|nr:alpha/beta fold hydrolase [Chloroflexota bacterium]
MEPQIQYARRPDGVRTAYVSMGSGPTLMMPPGALTHLDWYLGATPVQEAFCQRLGEVRTLVMYDRHGCGLSDRNRTDFTFEDDMLDIEAVVGAVGATEIDLFGVSWGGMPCLMYAARHPERVRRMVLYGAFSQGERGPGEREEERAAALRALRKTDWDLYNKTQANKYFPSGAERETLESLARMLGDSTTPEMAEQLDQVSGDTQSMLNDITTPTLVLHRRGDEAVPFLWGQYMARRIPDCSFMPLDGDAHFPWVNADQVLSPTIEFLTEADYTGGERGEADQAGAVTAGVTLVSKPAEKTFASGRYVVQRLLGQGAQKSVYLVDDTTLGRQCAISILNPALLDQSDIDRIKREAQTMAQFGTHPNIVTVHDYGEEDGSPFVICEYVPGGELRDELNAAAGPLRLERALAVATDICRALSFAHGRDIVHRDLKPENVWLTEERGAKLGDFGIALSLGRSRLTMPGSVSGTALYMAPEQASGGEIDARTDLYALGALLYELVTGSPPFTGDDPNAIIYQHVNNQPESPTTHNASVPPSLEGLIMRLLAKEKAERPASAEEVLTELEHAGQELAGGQPGAPTAVRTTEERPVEQEIRFCTSADGTRIAYATYGESAARAVVAVQNFYDVQEYCWKVGLFRTLYEGLASGRRLVTFDRRGIGGSQRDVDDVAIPAQVADLAAVVDKLGLESFDLVCWFGGGPLAAAYAVEHPERVGRLVIWSPTMRTSGSVPRFSQDLAQSIRANWALARRSWAAIIYPNGPTELQRRFSNMMRDSVAPEVAARHFEADAEFDGSTILPSIQAPTLVLANQQGVQSEIASIQAVASLIPDARLLTLEGDRGTVTLDPSQLLAAIRNFLDGTDDGSEAGV